MLGTATWGTCWALGGLAQSLVVHGHPLGGIWLFFFYWPHWPVKSTVGRMSNTHSAQFSDSFSYDATSPAIYIVLTVTILWCFWILLLLRVPGTARSNQPTLKEINPKYSLKGLMLKLLYFGHLMWELTHWKRPWCWERLRAGGEGDDRGWDSWMASPTQWTWIWANSGRQRRTAEPGVLQSNGFTKSQTQLRDWTTTL